MADSLLSRAHRMDGVHDLGGKQGFGPVRYASSRTAFKVAWEPRANALYLSAFSRATSSGLRNGRLP
jgi:Nitrile hydratase beta subunit, N-terminal